jgi:hypothetical protein
MGRPVVLTDLDLVDPPRARPRAAAAVVAAALIVGRARLVRDRDRVAWRQIQIHRRVAAPGGNVTTTVAMPRTRCKRNSSNVWSRGDRTATVKCSLQIIGEAANKRTRFAW